MVAVFTYSYPGDFIRIKKVVESNYLQPIEIEDLAFLCEMSLANFKSKFKEIYQTTPAKWLKEKRLARAHELLSTLQYSTSEIGQFVGFKDDQAFIQAYKQKYKTVPGNKRK